ncbi:hypothetical protein BDR26DRAFT_864178 [Obelidium mucronatum]|nr:hypothetical protein BDR26DRAFT_864178 [Obelidium mucronatum]
MGYDTHYYGAIKFQKPLAHSVRLQFLTLQDQSGRNMYKDSNLPKGPLKFDLITEDGTSSYYNSSENYSYEYKLLAAKEPVTSILVFQLVYLRNQDNKPHVLWLDYLLTWFQERGLFGTGHLCVYGEEEDDRYEVQVKNSIAVIIPELRYMSNQCGNPGENCAEDESDCDPNSSITVQECRVWEADCRKLLIAEKETEKPCYCVNQNKLELPFESGFLEELKKCVNASERQSCAESVLGNPEVPEEYKRVLLASIVELRGSEVKPANLAKDLSFCKMLIQITFEAQLAVSLEDFSNVIASNCPTIREVTITNYGSGMLSTSELVAVVRSLHIMPLSSLIVYGLSDCSQSVIFQMIELHTRLELFNAILGHNCKLSTLKGTSQGVLQKIAQLPILHLDAVVFSNADLTEVFVNSIPTVVAPATNMYCFPRLEHVIVRPENYNEMYSALPRLEINRPLLRMKFAYVVSSYSWS